MIFLYQNEDELNGIKTNIDLYCNNHIKYFSQNSIKLGSIGIVELQLIKQVKGYSMLYVSRKISDDTFEIKDTESNNCFIKAWNELEAMYDQGVHIQGVIRFKRTYSWDGLVINPVGFQVELTPSKMLRSKLLTGSTTGIEGFEIIKDDEKGYLCRLDGIKLNAFLKKNNVKHGFVLKIPDFITYIDSDFATKVRGLDYYIHIELPSSLISINSYAFGSSCETNDICSVHINSILDTIGDRREFWYVHFPLSKYLYRDRYNVLNVRYLYTSSFGLEGVQGILDGKTDLYLPYIEVMEKDCFVFGSISPVMLHIGKRLRGIEAVLYDTAGSYKEEDSGFHITYGWESSLMRETVIFDIPDNSGIGYIDLIRDRLIGGNNCIDFSSYTLLLSEYEYRRLKNVIDSAELNKSVALGIIVYKTKEEYEDLKSNLIQYFMDYENYFSNVLSMKSLGKTELLKLNKFS